MNRELSSLLPGFFVLFPSLDFNDASLALPSQKVVSRDSVKNDDASINKDYFPDRATKPEFYFRTRYL